jgi:hypothetical protein
VWVVLVPEAKHRTQHSLRVLTDTLKVGRREAEQIAALLEAQGYAKRSGTERMTTPQGESVSSPPACRTLPRFFEDTPRVSCPRVWPAGWRE